MVIMYLPRAWKELSPDSPTSLVIRPKTPIGRKTITPPVSFIIAWKPASKRPTSFWRGFSGRLAILIPSRMQKKMTASMSGAAAAARTFSGTMSSSSSIGEPGVSRSGSPRCSAPAIEAPTPGLIKFTAIRPARIASRLVST